MKLRLLTAASSGFALVLALATGAQAAEIRLLASNAMKTVLADLAPKFEQASQHKLLITFGTAAGLKGEIEKGAAVDVALITTGGIDDLIKQGKLATGSRLELARSGAGVAIRKGAPKPAIGTADAFKKTLLDAKSITYVEQGATGIYLKTLFEKMGIAEQMKAKTKFSKSAAEAVANGEAELGFTQIAEILPYAGAEVLGPLPAEYQLHTSFSLGSGPNAQNDATKALVAFLSTPAAAAVIKAKGLEPVAKAAPGL